MYKNIYLLTLSFFIMAAIVIYGCFPQVYTNSVDKKNLHDNMVISSPSKIFTKDASIYIMPEGFLVAGKNLKGAGVRYPLTGIGEHNGFVIPLDSITAVTYYKEELRGGRETANFILHLTGIPIAIIGTYCTFCPKCCFGSCPTVYTFDGSRYGLETELFSYSVSRLLEENDIDRLDQLPGKDGIYCIRITNEALETHYINKFVLSRVTHPAGSAVYTNTKGGVSAVGKLIEPSEVLNSKSEDVKELVSNVEERSYRSDTALVSELKEGICYDWLDVKIKIPAEIKHPKLLIRYRNTLMSTILYYEVVLGSQGLEAVDWQRRMDYDTFYAAQFGAVYKAFSGISVLVKENGTWKFHTKLGDPGPLMWKYTAAELPASPTGEMELRLQFMPDNFMIDYVGIDIADIEDSMISSVNLKPVFVIDRFNKINENAAVLFEKDDSEYLVTEPGDFYTLTYKVVPDASHQTTMFVSSKGYYTEWLRGTWITNFEPEKKFNLEDINRTIYKLADSWTEHRNTMEREFFNTRIPLRGAK